MVCENISLGMAGIIDCISSGAFGNNDSFFLVTIFFAFAALMYYLRIPMRYSFGIGLIVSFLFIPFSSDIFSIIFVSGLLLIGYFITRGVASGFKEN